MLSVKRPAAASGGGPGRRPLLTQNPTGVLAEGCVVPFRPAGAAAPAGGPYKRAAGEEFWGLKIALPSKETVKVERRLSELASADRADRHAATLLLGCSSWCCSFCCCCAAAAASAAVLLPLPLLLPPRAPPCAASLCAEPSPFMMRSLRRKASRELCGVACASAQPAAAERRLMVWPSSAFRRLGRTIACSV